MYYKITVAGLERNLPVCKLNEDISIAAFVIHGDVEMSVAAARELIKLAPEHDVMITAESKGIPLIHEMARQMGVKRYVLARKSPKLYMQDVISSTVKSITTMGTQTLFLDKVDADYMNGKKVLIIDDVVSTGESLKSLEKLVQTAGGNIVGKMAILVEGNAKDRDDVISIGYLPLLDKDGEPLK